MVFQVITRRKYIAFGLQYEAVATDLEWNAAFHFKKAKSCPKLTLQELARFQKGASGVNDVFYF